MRALIMSQLLSTWKRKGKCLTHRTCVWIVDVQFEITSIYRYVFINFTDVDIGETYRIPRANMYNHVVATLNLFKQRKIIGNWPEHLLRWLDMISPGRVIHFHVRVFLLRRRRPYVYFGRLSLLFVGRCSTHVHVPADIKNWLLEKI